MDRATREYLKREVDKASRARVRDLGRIGARTRRQMEAEVRKGEMTPEVFELLSPKTKAEISRRVVSHRQQGRLRDPLFSLFEYEGGMTE